MRYFYTSIRMVKIKKRKTDTINCCRGSRATRTLQPYESGVRGYSHFGKLLVSNKLHISVLHCPEFLILHVCPTEMFIYIR